MAQCNGNSSQQGLNFKDFKAAESPLKTEFYPIGKCIPMRIYLRKTLEKHWKFNKNIKKSKGSQKQSSLI